MSAAPLKYRRILLKLSGEALMGNVDYGIDPVVISDLAAEIVAVQRAGAEVGLVIGGGNIFRGAGLAAAGMDRVTGDHMGMLATVINALAMADALEKQGGFAYAENQTPWQEIQRSMVDQLSDGMVLKPAVKYQRIAQKSVPRDNH